MTHISLTDPAGKPIDKWDAWARPKSSYQWKVGRSAMELAKAWFRGSKASCPAEVRALLDSSEATRGLVLNSGRPEHVTPLPERGEGRNHDLWLLGDTAAGRFTLCVEAKADESFGERLGKQIQTARKRQPNTRVAERARALLGILLGKECNPEGAPWRELRYQLITAAAGAVLQAKIDHAVAAVLVIHEFHGSTTAADKLTANQGDLDQFIALLHPGTTGMPTGQMIGPIQLPPSALLPGGMPLYVGKVVTELARTAFSTETQRSQRITEDSP